MAKPVEQLEQVIIRFAGDSGDGMQLTGGRFTSETALLGNDLSTLPDFPAEIRAPAGSLPGVSGFQLHFADHDILTPGDAPDVLVAMNPAALKTNLRDLPKGGALIVNRDAFTGRNLEKAGYAASPLEDGSLDEFHVHEVPLTTLTLEALKDVDVSKREAERSKNMFALGLMSWLYHRPTENTIAFLERKFQAKPQIAEANVKAFKAGWAYGETSEDFVVSYEVAPAPLAPGTYRNITGNQALGMGLIAASVKSGLPLFLGAYPITPASEILENLSRHKRFGVRTFQAEDEIAAVGAEVGELPEIPVEFADGPNRGGEFLPYVRDPETLARDWAIPGTPGLEHRIGGLEKQDETGNVSYDPDNHDHMVRLRAQKVAGIAADIPELSVDDPDGASVLVLGWGGTYGPITAAVRRVRNGGGKVAQAHLTHLNPFPRNTGDVLRSYHRVLVPEMNLGQLLKLVRAEFLVDAVGYNQVRGVPLRASALADAIEALL